MVCNNWEAMAAPAPAPSAAACAETKSKNIFWVDCYGAIAGDTNDDSAAIEEAIQESHKVPAAVVLFTAGKYLVSRPINGTGAHLSGLPAASATGRGSIISVMPNLALPITAVIEVKGRPALIDNLKILAESRAETAITLSDIPGPLTVLKSLQLGGALRAGLRVQRVLGLSLLGVFIVSSGKMGFEFRESGQVYGRDLSTQSNQAWGFWIEGDYPTSVVDGSDTNFLAGYHFVHGDIEKNLNGAIYILNVRRKSELEYFWIENGGTPVIVDSSQNLRLSHMRAVGAVVMNPPNYVMRVIGNTTNCIFEHLSFLGSSIPILPTDTALQKKQKNDRYIDHHQVKIDPLAHDNLFYGISHATTNFATNIQIQPESRNTALSGVLYTLPSNIQLNAGLLQWLDHKPIDQLGWPGDVIFVNQEMLACPKTSYNTPELGCKWQPH